MKFHIAVLMIMALPAPALAADLSPAEYEARLSESHAIAIGLMQQSESLNAQLVAAQQEIAGLKANAEAAKAKPDGPK